MWCAFQVERASSAFSAANRLSTVLLYNVHVMTLYAGEHGALNGHFWWFPARAAGLDHPDHALLRHHRGARCYGLTEIGQGWPKLRDLAQHFD